MSIVETCATQRGTINCSLHGGLFTSVAMSCMHPACIYSCALSHVCSAYILKLDDVVRHMFGVEMFARFAGTRTRAMLDSPVYKRLDEVHGHVISALSSQVSEHPGDSGLASPEVAGPSTAAAAPTCRPEDFVDPDPSDEIMTASGDVLTLCFALFVDGVQLHQHGRATTTVVGIKCLDLPGFLCNTDLACYPLAFIGGEKEPSNLQEFMSIILKQFKAHEPNGSVDKDGMCAGAIAPRPSSLSLHHRSDVVLLAQCCDPCVLALQENMWWKVFPYGSGTLIGGNGGRYILSSSLLSQTPRRGEDGL